MTLTVQRDRFLLWLALCVIVGLGIALVTRDEPVSPSMCRQMGTEFALTLDNVVDGYTVMLTPGENRGVNMIVFDPATADIVTHGTLGVGPFVAENAR